MFGIGELSRTTGCPIETIRYYEKSNLLHPPPRTNGGHRLYNENHQKRLQFILKARGLGFSVDKTRELLSLSESNERPCSEALVLVEDNLALVNEKLMELHVIKNSLISMAANCKSGCSGAQAPDCTIVDSLFTKPLPSVTDTKGCAC